jgi:soluble lytic murein transglycosylase
MIRRILPLILALLPISAPAQDSPYTPVAALVTAGDWSGAATAAAAVSPAAASLVEWSRLRAGEGTFTDYQTFLAAQSHWPGLDRLRTQGEATIPQDADPRDVIAYFEDRTPRTTQGLLRLAAALTAANRAPEAEAALTAAWLADTLSAEGERALLAAYPDLLEPLHPARAEAMLWQRETAAAARLLPLLPDDQRLLTEARIAQIRASADRAATIAALPEDLRDHPGLAFDRFFRLADDGDYSDAAALLAARSTSAESLGQPARWSTWRATLARWAMREGRPDQAYALASAHFLAPEDGANYADLEWLAGYLALRNQDDPALALTNFTRVEAAARGPITLTRAAYWTGRALEAQGDPAAADAYARAAQYQTAFYGLLAAEKLGLPYDPAIAGTEEFPDWRDGDFLTRDMTQAMLYLLSTGDLNNAALFASRYGQDLDRTALGQLAGLFAALDEPYLAVVAGKQAADRGIIIPALYLPLHRLATLDLPVAPELALAIARRESEFNASVQSPVGARGLMQVMPGTGEEVAADLGLLYDLRRLSTDWEYSAILGSAYLAGLIEEFGQSPVLVAAGYNAGPGRPRTWMTQRGDPRTGEVDVIDWIEYIPFTETRTYVMRVTEALPAYRARLTGETGPIAFTALLNGAKPFIRPQARPVPGATPVADTETGATPSPGPAPAPTLRPVARPAG